jgi:hypothetical protein
VDKVVYINGVPYDRLSDPIKRIAASVEGRVTKVERVKYWAYRAIVHIDTELKECPCGCGIKFERSDNDGKSRK